MSGVRPYAGLVNGSPLADPAYDPWSAAFVADPYPAYTLLRQQPVSYHEPTDQWLVADHAGVSALLRDRRLGRTYRHVASHQEMGRQPPPDWQRPFWTLNDNGMLDTEGPDHTRLRGLVSRAFTPRTVERLRPAVRRLAAGLVDRLVESGGGDLMAAVAEPLPVAVIAELLGIPEADRPLLRPWSAAITGMFELNPGRDAAERAVAASTEFAGYLRQLIADRRRRPGDDLVSALTAVQDSTGGLTEQETVSTCVLLLNAGHEATVNTTGNGWLALLRHPDQLARLRAEPGLLPTAVEELLRYDTPLQLFERWVLTDLEISGVRIERGAELALVFGSANRDPARFADPDRLDLGRRDNPHLSFGAGIHFCLGAALARLELAESFAAVLARAPGLRLAGEPRWRPGYVIRGLASLPVGV